MQRKQIGLLITTYNRPDYLERCLKSLSKADLTDIKVLFVDDCSTDKKVRELIDKFQPHYFIGHKENEGVAGALLRGYDFLFSINCEIVINLDSDTIVKKDFIEKLIELREKYPNDVITGFNTQSKNENGVVRHPIIKQHEDHCIKISAGGVNYLVSKNIYESTLKGVLISCKKKQGDWDNVLCSIIDRVICTTPSVIQHIGEDSSIGVRFNPDKAQDFIIDDTIVINQPRGLGDIIFSMKAVLDFAKGRRILWPVMPQFVNIQKHFPQVEFIDWTKIKINYDINTEYQSEYGLVIPLRFSDSLCGVPYYQCMMSKYLYFNKDWHGWRHIFFITKPEDENNLYNMVLSQNGIKPGEPFNLINSTFRSDKSGKINIFPNNGLKNIVMSEIGGYTLLDWSKIIREAEHIFTVGTSINYLIELLDTKAKSINLYVRKPDEKDFRNYEYILSKEKPYVLKG